MPDKTKSYYYFRPNAKFIYYQLIQVDNKNCRVYNNVVISRQVKWKSMVLDADS